MAGNALQKELAETLRHTFGDFLDLPVLVPVKRSENNSAHGAQLLANYAQKIKFCEDCGLHIGRQKLVFARGSWQAKIAFVGDFPSTADDAKGEPFSDESGALLTKMIIAMKLKPESVYLTNIFKCRPPAAQRIEREHFEACERHLAFQFTQVKAPLVVAMGDHAARALARSEAPLQVLRKQIFEWEGRKVICTHHPRDLLQSPAHKKEAWDDLQIAMRELGTL